MIERRNEGAIVAAGALARELGIGLFYDTVVEPAAQLRRGETMQALRARVRQEGSRFTFDHHVPALDAFFHAVIAGAKAGRGRQA